MGDEVKAAEVKEADVKSQYVKLRGLSFSVDEKEIRDFFGGLSITRVKILSGYNGKATGEAIVEMGSKEDAGKAMLLDKKEVKKRYIEVFSTPQPDGEGAFKAGDICDGNGENDRCMVRLRGVPWSCGARDVKSFFVGPKYRLIYLMMFSILSCCLASASKDPQIFPPIYEIRNQSVEYKKSENLLTGRGYLIVNLLNYSMSTGEGDSSKEEICYASYVCHITNTCNIIYTAGMNGLTNLTLQTHPMSHAQSHIFEVSEMPKSLEIVVYQVREFLYHGGNYISILKTLQLENVKIDVADIHKPHQDENLVYTVRVKNSETNSVFTIKTIYRCLEDCSKISNKKSTVGMTLFYIIMLCIISACAFGVWFVIIKKRRMNESSDGVISAHFNQINGHVQFVY